MASAAKRHSSLQSAPPEQRWNLRRAGGVRVLEASALAHLSWLVHGFSTREGGASELVSPKRQGDRKGKLARVLNLGFTDWDSRERVAANRSRFFGAIGAGKFQPVTMQQIHSDVSRRVDSSAAGSGEPLHGDALFTRQPGFLLAVQTADCIPILLVDARLHAVAAIHAGWRGTLRRIAAKTLGRMRMEFGTRPEDVIAVLGPGIGRCCYEVGEEVAREFNSQFPDAAEWFEGPFEKIASGENDPNWLPWLTMMPPGHALPPVRVHLDLIAANRALLVSAGVPGAQIYDSEYCTACRTDLFFSYRRERTTGRMMAAIGVR